MVCKNFIRKRLFVFPVRTKMRDKLVVIATFIALAMFLVLVVQTELNMVNRLPIEEHSVNGNHHPVMQRRFLNREEASKMSGENSNSNHNQVIDSTSTPLSKTNQAPRDNFTDLFKYTMWSKNFRRYLDPPHYVLPEYNPTLQDVLKIDPRENFTNWEKFHLQISRLEMYPEDSQVVDAMLKDIAQQRIVALEQFQGGTQLKLVITFENGGQAMFKPMRFPRETETLPDHFYFTDYERHVSEIATFHLDRLLGFRRAPPVTGRIVNLTSEIYPLADDELRKTFFVSPAGNICFFGHCSYYCDTSHPICGHPDMLEGSFAAFLPPRKVLHRRAKKSPWRRSYNKRRKAVWENNSTYCDEVKKNPAFGEGRRLYDIMDMATMDFLTGNMDRHHYEETGNFGNDSALIHWDHGRGFGKSRHDEMSILAPIEQCCIYRLSTFNRLYEFHNGPIRLSRLMEKVMENDLVSPVLTRPHLDALDRRVGLLLATIRKCLRFNPSQDVFLDDVSPGMVDD